jgi:GDP-L-fucose synthase
MRLASASVFVTGAYGFLGRQVCQALRDGGATIWPAPPRGQQEFDLRRIAPKGLIDHTLRECDAVIHLASVVGGIGFNREHPVEMVRDNTLMNLAVLDAAYRCGIKKFIGLGSVCAYPKYCPVPFREDNLYAGYPEETNAPYSASKRILLEASQAYRQQYGFNAIHLIPTNLYGPGDSFDDDKSHVIPALIKRFVKAAEVGEPSVTVWGTGRASREFLYVKDCAEAIVAATERYDGGEPVNLGSGEEVPIFWLAQTIAKLTGFKGKIEWDASKPDGQPRRCLDTSRAKAGFGWKAKVSLMDGLAATVDWWKSQRTADEPAVALA